FQFKSPKSQCRRRPAANPIGVVLCVIASIGIAMGQPATAQEQRDETPATATTTTKDKPAPDKTAPSASSSTGDKAAPSKDASSTAASSKDSATITERERLLLERIERLEQRLATLESRTASGDASSKQPNGESSAVVSTVSKDAASNSNAVASPAASSSPP